MPKLSFCLLLFIQFQVLAQNIEITSFRTVNELKDSVYSLQNKEIVLDYRSTHLLFKFKDTQDSAKAVYSYMLKGFDKKWILAGSETNANYINLFGGKYEFMVKNLNHSNKIATLKIHLKEAFWQKTWFVPSVAAFLMFVAGIIFYFFQVNKFKEQAKLFKIRDNISADLHDDIGSTLANISFLTEIAKTRIQSKPEDVPMLLDKILEDSKDMVQTMRGMIWTINPGNDNALDFFTKVKQLAHDNILHHNIKLDFDINLPENQKLKLEAQRNLYLIFKEAVHNVIKYSRAENLDITIRKEKDWLMIQIKDNGRGFEIGADTEGNGLRNMKNRINQIDGTFELENTNGIRIRMAIPIT